MHEALAQNVHQYSYGSGASQVVRIGEALQALTGQLVLLRDVLQNKIRAYSNLSLFPTRVLACARVQQLSARICEHITEVLPDLTDTFLDNHPRFQCLATTAILYHLHGCVADGATGGNRAS